MTPREELAEEIRKAMALCKKVAAGLAASPTGYRPPAEDGEANGNERRPAQGDQ